MFACEYWNEYSAFGKGKERLNQLGDSQLLENIYASQSYFVTRIFSVNKRYMEVGGDSEYPLYVRIFLCKYTQVCFAVKNAYSNTSIVFVESDCIYVVQRRYRICLLNDGPSG